MMKRDMPLLVWILMASAVFGNTRDDIVAWRGTDSDWYMSYTKDTSPYLDGVVGSSSSWGEAGEVPMIGDVTGDGVDDIVMLRNESGQWTWLATHSLLGSSGAGLLGNGEETSSLSGFGAVSSHLAGFLSDVTGDGCDDAVVTTTNGSGSISWSAKHSTSAGLDPTAGSSISWGETSLGDIPVMGDFNGDGYVDAAVFRGGAWYVAKSTASGLSTAGTASGSFGASVDIPMVGDMNGDGRDDGVVVRVGPNGDMNWFAGYSDASGNVAGNGWADLGYWGDVDGASGSFADTPVLADIDGDGIDDIGVYRNWPGGFSQWIFKLSGGGDVSVSMGFDGDLPLIGQFNAPPFDYVHNPVPADDGGGAQDLNLGWSEGTLTVQSDVYLGTNYTDVLNADSSDVSGIYRGRTASESYDPPGELDEYTRYYWRIDDVNGSGAVINTGEVWSFLTARNVDSGSWVAIDALNRVLPDYGTCGPVRNGKFTGIFYFSWHVQDIGPYDITQIIADAGGMPVPQWDPDSPQYQTDTVNHFHHWGEPELGYYHALDEYVIRKHARMLVNAGINVIILDATNAITYRDVYFKICAVYRQIRAEGGQTPQICFITHSSSVATTQMLYDEFYSQGFYKDLWFHWDGKPLIFADFSGHSSEVLNFFTIRYSWAWDAGYKKWQWIDTYPQNYGWDVSSGDPTQIPVAVASHPTVNRGTSYKNYSQPAINAYGLTAYTGQGRHFAEQAEYALGVDPDFLWITGWNEWIAQRFLSGSYQQFLNGYAYAGETYFVDAYNQEYNRDIEPMKGGHTDNYLYQMAGYVRRFKGVDAPAAPTTPKQIAIDGVFSEWADVGPEFRDHLFDTTHRNYRGFGTAGPYVNTSGRNDIAASKVTYDNDYIYIYVETRENITSYTDPNWMLLFINSDQSRSTGWEGYDYIVNYGGVGASTTTLKQNVGGAWNWTTINSAVAYAVSGNKMELRIPRSNLGETTANVEFDFHWADNIQNTDDIIEFAVNGDSAPDRRYNYRYESSLPVPADTDAPTPNPAQWASVPTAAGQTEITMTATAGSDASGPVEYSFEETSGHAGGTDSGWQTSASYTDTGLAAGTLYTYRVRMRDALDNTGSWSSSESAATDPLSPVQQYAAWVAGYGLDTNSVAAATTNDIEPDGMANLVEYGLGGNPTTNDAAGILPTFSMTLGGGSNFIDYVYRRRLDAALRGLDYDLYASTNLLDGWMLISNAWETGAAAIDADFEAVTNTVPFTTDEGFIQLKIKGDF